MKVRVPMIMTSHCQVSKPGVEMPEQPYAIKSTKTTAAPFMRTGNRVNRKSQEEPVRMANVHQYPVLSICSARV